MESVPRWIAVAVGFAMLALGACSATGPTLSRAEPALRFSPGDNQSERCNEHEDPARVRRDAYGRPIHFREIPLDRHGGARDVQGARCGSRGGYAEEGESAAQPGSDR